MVFAHEIFSYSLMNLAAINFTILNVTYLLQYSGDLCRSSDMRGWV